jgi:hypothetical protein
MNTFSFELACFAGKQSSKCHASQKRSEFEATLSPGVVLESKHAARRSMPNLNDGPEEVPPTSQTSEQTPVGKHATNCVEGNLQAGSIKPPLECAPTSHTMAPTGRKLTGQRISVYWKDDDEWYPGIIQRMKGKLVHSASITS